MLVVYASVWAVLAIISGFLAYRYATREGLGTGTYIMHLIAANILAPIYIVWAAYMLYGQSDGADDEGIELGYDTDE